MLVPVAISSNTYSQMLGQIKHFLVLLQDLIPTLADVIAYIFYTKVSQAALLWLVSQACQTSTSAWGPLNSSISPGQVDSHLYITTQLAGDISHGSSSSVWCVCGTEIALIDAIWLFLILIKDSPTILWLHTTSPHPCKSAYGVGSASEKL